MARNRKHQSAAVRFAPAIKVLVACSFLVGAGVGYVWQKEQLVDLGRRKAALERRLSSLQDQTGKLEEKLLQLQTPKALEIKANDLKLGLRPAQANQIIQLAETSRLAVPSARETPRQYTRRDSDSNQDRLAKR